MMWTNWPRSRRRKWRDPPLTRIKNRGKISRHLRIAFTFVLVFYIFTNERVNGAVHCPPIEAIPSCPCYNFVDGLFLECASSTEESLRYALARVLNQSKSEGVTIQSLSVYELDRKVEELKSSLFPNGVQIRHLQISRSNIREISDSALHRLSRSLESLALTSGRLTGIPQKAFSDLSRLGALDLEANLIHDLPNYSFYRKDVKMSLMKLNLKGNQIAKVSEFAFAGLEDKLKDLDLTENKIRVFPMTALRRLDQLTSLRLSWNEISQLPEDGNSRLNHLNFLDLSSNNFLTIPVNCFRCCPSLRTLTFYYNAVEVVDKDAFISLKDLESIDLSHNKIIFLDVATFRANQKLRSIDLSHNHLHYIWGIFSKLPELKELFLTENNILEIPAEAFSGSSSLNIINLQHNAIRKIDSRGLISLSQLTQLHLTGNFIEKVPRDFFEHCENLSILSLDGNSIRELEVGTFARAKHLRELRLQDNQITEVRRGVFAPLPSLVELHLQNNAITDMETGALRTLQNLQHVNLQGNLLAVLGDVFQVSNEVGPDGNVIGSSLVSIQLDNNGLGVLHNDSLRGQASVRVMWLGHNRLTRLQAPLFRDLLLVERLYLTNNSITRIEDTAFAPMQSLKFLDLSVNKLSHVTVKTFSELHELEELYLSDNGLRKLDSYALTSLKRLRVLDLSNNHLTSLHETMFKEGLPIRLLNLRNCSITTIELRTFQGLNNLYELNLEYNHLKANAWASLDIPGLRVIKISWNSFSQISRDSLEGLPSLQHLTMESSRIDRLPRKLFSRNKNLNRIVLNGNLLHALPSDLLQGLDFLKELRLDGNRFQEVPYEIFTNASTVELVSLAKNKISTVNVTRLQGLTSLRELVLRDNYIMMMSFGRPSLTKLISVDLSRNHLSELPENFFAHSSLLRNVELSNNSFSVIPEMALSSNNIHSLVWLNMSSNPLVRVHNRTSSAKYPALQEVHITRTNLEIITSQDFDGFPELLHLFLSNNHIRHVSTEAFDNLKKLQTLDLSGNNLPLLPQHLLKRLDHLRLLNLTRNQIEKLEDFPANLKELQILDVSHNKIANILNSTFQNLENLAELHLLDNWISKIGYDAFRPLKKLKILDMSKNYLENIPLNAFKPLETHIRSLRTEGNPLHCGCESQELWEWLRDHQKLIGRSVSGGAGVAAGGGGGSSTGSFITRHRGGVGAINETTTTSSGLLRCEQPPELKGHIFLDLDPTKLCTAPAMRRLAVQDIQPHSFLATWQSDTHWGLYGYQVLFYLIDDPKEVSRRIVKKKNHSLLVTKLLANARYRVCVRALGNWLRPKNTKSSNFMKHWSPSHPPDSNDVTDYEELALRENGNDDILDVDTAMAGFNDSQSSRCTEVMTPEEPDAVASSDGSQQLPTEESDENSSNSKIATKKLGLVVGCCLGLAFFVLLASLVGYIKMKKQRAVAKRDGDQTVTPEYISYRHYSLQGTDGGTGTVATKTTTIAQHHHKDGNNQLMQHQTPVVITSINSVERQNNV